MLSNGDINSIYVDNSRDEFYTSRSMLYTFSKAGDFTEEDMGFTIADRLCMRFPLKMLAKITSKSTKEFCVSFIEDTRKFKFFDEKLQQYYSEDANRRPVDFNNPQVQVDDFVCVCDMGSRYFRCRLMSIESSDPREPMYKVHFFDIGAIEVVRGQSLYYIADDFSTGDYHFAFTLKCATPDIGLKKLNLQGIEEFRVGEVVDILLCSIHEPCLALLGSRKKHFKRLRPEIMTEGFDPKTTETWTNLFLGEPPSKNGQLQPLPMAQPSVTEDWSYMVVANITSVEDISVRDFPSLLRLSVLNEIINQYYQAPIFVDEMRFKDLSQITLGTPCVVFNGIQYARGEIIAHSADRSVVDIRCVDYPQIVVNDKKIREDKVFMLSETFNLPPQCFSVRICECKSEEQLHRYSAYILEHINIGSMVIVKGLPNTTKVFMKGDDDSDMLGLVKMHDAGIDGLSFLNSDSELSMLTEFKVGSSDMYFG